MVGWRPGSSSKSPQLLNCTTLKCEKNVLRKILKTGASLLFAHLFFFIQEDIRIERMETGKNKDLNNIGEPAFIDI